MGWNRRRGNKHNNRITWLDGHKFQSLMERQRYVQLCLLSDSGAIRDLKVHPEFEIIPAYPRPGEPTRSGERQIPITIYEADFAYVETDTGYLIIEDVKGQVLPVFQLKRKLFELQYVIDDYPKVQFRLITQKEL
jgi:hypothetical protein